MIAFLLLSNYTLDNMRGHILDIADMITELNAQKNVIGCLKGDDDIKLPTLSSTLKISNVMFDYGEDSEKFYIDNLEFPSNSRTLVYGESGEGKSSLANLIAGAEGQLRDDVIFVADTIELTTKDNKFTNKLPGDASAWVNKISDSSHETRLISVYDAYLTTEDIYSATSGVETYVSPTYFLAGLIPYNELTYGCSYTNAGKRRGEVSDALYLSKNPTPEEKDALYAERLNYIEKDSTGMYFMSQSTYQQEDTALRFLNNSRSLNVIARNVERIGRNYLHEATTVTS